MNTGVRAARGVNWRALATTGCALLLLAAPLLLSSGQLKLLTEVLLVFAIAQSWNLLAGYAGLMSFGHQGFIGVGAYFVFYVSGVTGANPLLLLPLAGLFTAACAALVAPLVLRLRDAYLAIGLWVLAEVARLYVSQSEWLGGVGGMPLTATRTMNHRWVTYGNYWAAAAIAFGALFGLHALLRTRLGLALAAVRDVEQTATAAGLDVWRTRFLGLVIAAGACGVAGAVYYMAVFHVDPGAAFDPNWVVVVLFIVILGGIGTIEGPAIGTIVYFLLRGLLAEAGNWYLMVLGGAAVAVMLLEPRGLWGLARRRWRIEPFGTRRLMPHVGSGATGETAGGQVP